MTLTQVWGAFLLFLLCPILGGLPLIGWITQGLTGRKLSQSGTGNVSVSAAFYHGGTAVGVLAVLSEALKGVAAVLLARYFFPQDAAWEIIALIALVMGRYWVGRGAGTTNVVWGYIVHDPGAAFLVFLIGGVGFTLLRERRQARIGILILFALITTLRHPGEGQLVVATICLALLLGWIYQKIPDDLDLDSQSAQMNSQRVFRFFRGDRAILTLEQPLQAKRVGQKAATLAKLRRLGYPVPAGWLLRPGDDPQVLIELLDPSPKAPLVVRSSAIGEDSEQASAAGQYETVLNVTSRDDLLPAISHCLNSYDRPEAVRYRRDRGVADAAMAVLIQQQVQGVFSGVAFSRDPIARQGDAVVIEALPGGANRVVSGQVTPESYRVLIGDTLQTTAEAAAWLLPDDRTLTVEGQGDVPPRLIQQVAYLARHLEGLYHGIPQDVEWSYDGQALWLLQTRPITTLLPIWTRKIAAEVIPGVIRPLTWSINRPLTCGVWGQLFTMVLGNRARGLDFNATATLHYSRAYFNASLLGQTFLRMGLPPESLEFLTRGARFSKPPLASTLQNIPGLLRLLQRELRLEQDFRQDHQRYFTPALTELALQPATHLSPPELLQRIDRILALLKQATYYSILAPLSAALRKAIAKVPDEQIDNGQTPEVAALRELQALARSAREVLSAHPSGQGQASLSQAELFHLLAEMPQGQAVLQQFDRLLERYGYLSEVGTDIAVPTWREAPQPVRELLTQFCLNPPPDQKQTQPQTGKARSLQRRFDLKGQVTAVYSQLLAELRWSFVALEQNWLQAGLLAEPGDLFFLELEEIRQVVVGNPAVQALVQTIIGQRQAHLADDRKLTTVPALVYGEDPPTLQPTSTQPASRQLQGIGASPGRVEGRVKVLRNLDGTATVDRDTILVVPYTDSGWAPLLARAGGLIAEVGGRLSHGAIVAREYRIPAVMDIHDATQVLWDGQQVRIDGQLGIVEIL